MEIVHKNKDQLCDDASVSGEEDLTDGLSDYARSAALSEVNFIRPDTG